MFHEQIAQITGDHLRTHITAYLAEVGARYTDKVTLVTPKSIKIASVVGGQFKSFDEILPEYGIDISDKVYSPTSENLGTYMYTGQVNGMVHARSRDDVDKICLRHSAAVELFIRRHLILHQVIPSTQEFTIIEYLFSGMSTSGAEEVGEVDGVETWFAGFSIDCAWLVSEEGGGQHG